MKYNWIELVTMHWNMENNMKQKEISCVLALVPPINVFVYFTRV